MSNRPVWATGHQLLVGFLIVVATSATSAAAGEELAKALQNGNCIEVFKTAHFSLHTDLPPAKAAELLKRMEDTLKVAERYWGQPSRGQIECYVVDDLKSWPNSELPHALARVWVGGIGGATIQEAARAGSLTRYVATLYASSPVGVAEHEVVHAYCCQTFGATGPDWYKEGMAEEVACQLADGAVPNRPAERMAMLRKGQQKTVESVVRGLQTSSSLSDVLKAKLARRKERHVPLTDWTPADARRVHRLRDTYEWSWALCHMLSHNSNYSERFQALGTSFLSNGDDAFRRAFSGRLQEINFEYRFFLDRVNAGYRVDLCSWDWDLQFKDFGSCTVVASGVRAARGFQPSGLRVKKGERYAFRTKGHWSTLDNGIPTGASGDSNGHGMLVGAVLQEYQLTAQIDLGSDGIFVAPASGRLYLRCRDAWNELADNTGEVQIEFRPAE